MNLIRKMLQLFRHSGMDRRNPDCRDAPKVRAVHYMLILVSSLSQNPRLIIGRELGKSSRPLGA